MVRHAETDRNFHIFYQLLAGADAATLKSLGLSANTDSYAFLGKGAKPALSDKAGFQEVQDALTAIGFSAELKKTLYDLVAAVLLLGQLEFEPKGEHSAVKDPASAAAVAARLGTDAETLCKALTYRVVAARGEVAYSELNAERAAYSRNALSKALYDELFKVCSLPLASFLSPCVRLKAVVVASTVLPPLSAQRFCSRWLFFGRSSV